MTTASFTVILFKVLFTILHVAITWWWVVVPFILIKPLAFLYKWWRTDCWLKKQKWVSLEIKMPRDVFKPIRAMESAMASIHGASYQPPDPWETWVDGQVQLSVSFDIVSVGGETRFYIRTPVGYRDSIEAAIYTQYSEAEIKEVEDYTKSVPQNMPNKEWDLFGGDYKMLKDDHYPIKTYRQFETEREVVEEAKIDPMASLLEAMNKVKPGEQFWIQIMAAPIGETVLGAWIAQGKVLRDKLARRPEVSKPKPILQEAAGILITGKLSEEKVEKDIIPPEMKLTPGEKDVLVAIEEKMSKPIFNVSIRFIFLGKRDVWYKGNFRLIFTFFQTFATFNLNALFPIGSTFTKIHKHWFLPANKLIPRRSYLRCRKLFRNYIRRLSPFFPRPGGTFHLSTEEMASLYHFPGAAVAPSAGVSRVEAKRGEAPLQLPME